jgi:hypothetical protein
MTSLQTRRERVLAEAVVSAYINELATPRERPSHRPDQERERTLSRVVRLRRERSRRQPTLVTA